MSAEGTPDVRATRSGRARRAVRAAGVLTIVLALVVVGALVSPDFLSATNLVNAIRAVALLGIVATGVAFVTYSGHYADLSVPVVMAASGTAVVAALPAGLAAGALAGLGTAAALGLVNGYVIGYLRANPIVWTLVTASVLDGVLRWLYSGQQVYPDATHLAGRRFLALYGASIGPAPLVLVLSGLVIAAGHLLLSRTRFGAELALVGSAAEAARLSGVAVGRRVLGAFMLSSLAAGLGGVLLTSLNKVGAPYVGRGYDFSAVTAVVLGGVALSGGRGSVPGVLGGVLLIGLLANVLTLLGVGTFGQSVVQGVVFIAAVAWQQRELRGAGRDDA